MMFFLIIRLWAYASICVCLFSSGVHAQSWQSGFAYRKKITINKSKTEAAANPAGVPNLDLRNFPLLLVLEDPDLKYLPGRLDQKIRHPNGFDISFSTVSAPGVPLKYEIESYNAEKGLLVCWVQIPVLSARVTNSPPTSIYLYYGSDILYDPEGPALKEIWLADYDYVDHMNKSGPGKIGASWRLNGVTDKMNLKAGNYTETVWSAWIKLNRNDKEQVIVSREVMSGGGYRFKITSEGNLVVERFNSSGYVQWFSKGIRTLSPQVWYYVTAIFKAGNADIFLDGSAEASKIQPGILVEAGGNCCIGADQQNKQYFDGSIDEVRFGKQRRLWGILKTEYENQNNPSGFYVIDKEEMNPDIGPTFFVFLGSKSTSWNEPANWNTGSVPPAHANVKISRGKTADVDTYTKIGRLLIELGAVIRLNRDLEISSDGELEQGGTIISNTKSCLRLGGNVLNNGIVDLTKSGCSLTVAGGSTGVRLFGNGVTKVSELEVSMSDKQFRFNLEAALEVCSAVKMVRGLLQSNGKLVLCSSKNETCSIQPVLDLMETGIAGNVQVQHFVDGSFPSPSSGRGWRLLSSPVVNSYDGDHLKYDFQAIKQSVFVTGKGGTYQGFDVSPNNGATIYSHDQSLPGTLPQKYVAIPNMDARMTFGKGFFLFSRGSRFVQDAYRDQIEHPGPNPQPYLINYKGELFMGTLKLELPNRDSGNEGDGFNLVGNPYACPVKWGCLIKENLGPYLWLFDPLNNNYRVSDDPQEIIPAGTGFFVKVKAGFRYGYLSFSEACKVKL